MARNQPSIHYPLPTIAKGHSLSARITINHLSPELLSEIFLFCVAVWPTNSTHIPPFRGPSEFTCGDHLPWIAIAQVCRYWRSVALACGRLWNKLLFPSRKATNEMIRRSAGVVLVVKAGSDYQPTDENVRIVIPDIGRVSVLHLHFPFRYLQPLLRDISSIATPKLASLRLSTGPPKPSDPYFNPEVLFHVPDIMFTRNKHTLRILELSLCSFPWPSLLCLSSLAHLELCKAAIRPTMAEVLALLRGLPMLETLILDQSLPAHNDTCLDAISPRHFLPNLRVLTLGGRFKSCSNLLEHIAYPITTIATLNCETSSRESHSLSHFLPIAQSAFEYERDDHIIHSLSFAEAFGCFVLKCLVVHRSSTPLPSQNPQLVVVLSHHQIPFSELVRSTVATLPLADVQALDLSILWRSQINWSEFFQHLPKITIIYVHRYFPAGLMEILSQELGTFLLPHLRSLWLTAVHFSGDNLQFLLACLQFRAQVGIAIQELHLRDCWDLYGADVERMKKHVHDVDWDRVEQQELPWEHFVGPPNVS